MGDCNRRFRPTCTRSPSPRWLPSSTPCAACAMTSSTIRTGTDQAPSNVPSLSFNPSPITHHPSPLTHHPSPSTHHPSTITPSTHQPSTLNRQPSTIAHRASPITHHPSPITHHLSPLTSHPHPHPSSFRPTAHRSHHPSICCGCPIGCSLWHSGAPRSFQHVTPTITL